MSPQPPSSTPPSRRPTILCLGEIVWDLFPTGPLLGGAPLNFAAQSQALGADARLISRVGADPLGERALAKLPLLKLDAANIQRDSAHATGIVAVTLSGDGEPAYRIADESAWDHLEEDSALIETARQADGIYFGSLAQRHAVSRRTIRRLVAESPAAAVRIFDVNLRPPFFSEDVIRRSLELANVAKVNAAELNALGNMFDLGGASTEERAAALARKFDLHLVACTLGANGSLLWTSAASVHRAAAAVSVVDTVGAGDAFAASLVTGMLLDLPLEEIATHANELAAYVCSQPGATPHLPGKLRRVWPGSSAHSGNPTAGRLFPFSPPAVA